MRTTLEQAQEAARLLGWKEATTLALIAIAEALQKANDTRGHA